MAGRSGEKAEPNADAPGATASFPYDRITVERFRQSFPRARWSDDLKAWFVPGKMAAQRFHRWLERELAGTSTHADARGRDAYVFAPIVSKYLRVHDDRLEVQTPYSRSVVREMREVPFASWDPERRVWTVPYRSYDELHRRWTEIEAAAIRNEPAARKERAAQRRGSIAELASRARAAERRRRRYPLRAGNLPPFERPVMTRDYGVVAFTDCDGEPVAPELLRTHYPGHPGADDYVWGRWRLAGLDELVKTWPARKGSKRASDDVWWQPTLDELRVARKAARALERRRRRS
ncbi:hypothetical protein FJ434_20470 [Mesorhizobium sp. B2-5-13]|uniref:hypothetical protein n=1 Tax=unclassified Mesorhizobium TaxID=325217 RepID=UPI0011268483|nr:MULTISPECIES: hypothetical protein [unclassified Mesorhizobium]TPJ81880.1 hypothetical protein FJ434_20470 [Mesorhizobium sp. B2-5-13]TPK45910.1 hypothetical protein FJ560_20245 [Mesorhizobium sp. B2-5-5]